MLVSLQAVIEASIKVPDELAPSLSSLKRHCYRIEPYRIGHSPSPALAELLYQLENETI